ncbi:MAG TPA: hypothetical protein DCY13_24380, partial [Verrucomicrobiales bacterium]|nr:hypothetical protein [Verrucomicrobiales bacterium]
MKTTFARASKYFVLAGLLAGTAAMAQRITPEDWRRWEEEEIKLQKLNPLPDPEPEFWTATTIRGLVFVERLEDVDPKGVDAIGVTVRGPASLDAKGVAGRVWRFLGRNLNYETMRAIHAEVLAYLRDHNRPLVDVIFPEQDVTEGILQIVVREARVGRLELREPGAVTAGFTNRWGNTNYLSRMMRLQPGDVVDSKILEQDLDWVTRSPFRSISGQVSFRKGAGELETDIQAQIRHRKPWEVSIGYDNTGSVATDLDRIFAGVSGGKVLGTVDNYATYQFIADPELDHLKAHAVTYAALLPWRHTLRVFGYHSDTSAQISDLSTVTGDSYQASLRYEMPLPRLGRMQHEFSLGLDFKHLGNTLEFGGTVAQDNPWEVFQTPAGYVAAASDGWGRTIFTAEGFHSP